jgi:hypothetical protein
MPPGEMKGGPPQKPSEGKRGRLRETIHKKAEGSQEEILNIGKHGI